MQQTNVYHGAAVLHSCTAPYVALRYDTVDLRALKSWRDCQLNLAHGPETKNNEKNINQKPSSSEETVQAKVRGGSPGGRSETKGGRICERGRF